MNADTTPPPTFPTRCLDGPAVELRNLATRCTSAIGRPRFSRVAYRVPFSTKGVVP